MPPRVYESAIMRIIEFRIFLPLRFEKTQHATIYAVAKRISQETKGGEGFEVLESEEREHEGNTGLYVHRVMHFKSRIPGPIRWAIPEKYTIIHEHNFNCFPYYSVGYSIPGMGENMELLTETRHVEVTNLEDIPDNINKLSESDLKKREIIYIDLVDGPKSESPEFVLKGFSAPECEIPGFDTDGSESSKNDIPPWVRTYKGPMTCVIKTVKFRFKWFGIQKLVESFVINNAFYGTYMDTHRAMVTWVRDWYNMSLDECKEYEQRLQDELKNATFDEPESPQGK